MARRHMTPDEAEERENDPNVLTRRVYRHPWLMGLGFGSVIAAWVLILDLPLLLALGVGVAATLLTGLVWRPGGPGQRMRRWALRRFPKKDAP